MLPMVTLPGLIDIHVHLRDPGQVEKEDFATGTAAALAGGFTTVFDMPNNKIPITSDIRLEEKIQSAKSKAVSDIGFYFGSLGDNFDEFEKVKDKVFGIKLYLNVTTGHFLIDSAKLEEIYTHWIGNLPVLVHSEEESVDTVIGVVKKTGHRTHFCHVSSEYELSHILKARKQGLPVTCGVCPHHLFLTEDDVKTLKSHAIMKPPLKTAKDRDYLWEHINDIDVIESDHAPHTVEEKQSENPPFGVPGLETTLPLLITAEHNGKISRKRILEMCFANPQKILNFTQDPETTIDIDDTTEYEIQGKNFFSKCKWTPFEGWKVRGRVTRVKLRGVAVFENGNVLAKPGTGHVLSP
jgi:dihydroorotase